MSEALRDATDRLADVLPFAIDLELRVEDRDVVAALVNFPDGAAREEYALEALKIGVLALRRASSALDGDFIQRETTRLLETLRSELEGHARHSKQRVESSLEEYFHPESGHFSQRVVSLTKENGELSTMLSSVLVGEDSRLAKMLLAHVGENSPLMKHLSAKQSDGLLALLKTTVEGELRDQRDKILGEFSLNNEQGALRRLVKELSDRHGILSKDLQDKIDVVMGEFTLDNEDSALKRLVDNVAAAQSTITAEFSLDNEQSALRRLKTELTTILEAHIKVNSDFQEDVKIALGKLVTKRETEARGTQHGGVFEQAVYEFINLDAQRRGDVAEDTTATTGLIKGCKIGDAVVQLGCDCSAAGARVVFEAKEKAGYSMRHAQEEIEQARRNREAQQGVFVFSKRTAPAIPPLSRHGDDVFVVWDAEDLQTDSYLLAAIEISRALCVRAAATREAQKIDFTPIDKSVLQIEKHVGNLESVRTSAETIKSASEKILKRVEIDHKALNEQLSALRDAVCDVKLGLGNDEAAD